jgi:hypothetical protein
MTNQDESHTKRIIAFAVPIKIAAATRAVAEKDLCSHSDICRRALVRDLKERGFLIEAEAAGVA